MCGFLAMQHNHVSMNCGGRSRTKLMVLIPRFLHSAISCLPSTLLAAFCSRYSPTGTFVNCRQQTAG